MKCAKARVVPRACKEAVVAATRQTPGTRLARWIRSGAKVAAHLAGLLGGLFVSGGARAVDLPADRAESMVHLFSGGGVTAGGPALLVRKSLADRVSLSGSYYLDAVSNASIDVVTQASRFKETRHAFELGVDYVVRDTLISLGVARSDEPDYIARNASIDIAQEVFGGMTTVSLGFSRGTDDVSKTGAPEFRDKADHWQYRLGLTQILSPRWLASINAEALSDSGFLANPYRAARVFGASVPERHPRTRTARAVKLRTIGELGTADAIRAEYRYYWDTWDVRAHTAELGYARHLGPIWLAEGTLRLHTQSRALFYSDNATTETTFVSRSKQLSSFSSYALGGKLSYRLKRVPGKYEINASGSYEWMQFNYRDFTDVRTGKRYSFGANVLQLMVSANF
jgi:hypothetical protein